MVQKVLFEQEGAIGWITLHDPDRLNALSEEMAAEFSQLMTKLRKSPDIRCIVLTGAGRAFSAGGNLDMIRDKKRKSLSTNKKEMIAFYRSFLAIRELPMPVIAYLNGHAMGAGFCVALACDLRVALEEARFGVNFTKLGLSPGMAGSWLITELAGLPVACDLLLTGRTITATEAKALGLVNWVYAAGEAHAKVAEWARSIATNAPVAIRETKKLLRRNAHLSLEQALGEEAKGQAVCFQTKDLEEGVQAIREKRPPQFAGR